MPDTDKPPVHRYDLTHRITITQRVSIVNPNDVHKVIRSREANIQEGFSHLGWPEAKLQVDTTYQMAPGAARRDMARDVLRGYFRTEAYMADDLVDDLTELIPRHMVLMEGNGMYDLLFADTREAALQLAADDEGDNTSRAILIADLESGESKGIKRRLYIE